MTPPQPAAATKVPKFLRILYSILATESSTIIAWASCGTFFQVFDMAALENNVLPRYFKHNKFASFQRQLNNFGFRKWTKTRASVCTFSHDTLVRCPLTELPAMVAKAEVMSPHSKASGKRLRSDSDSDSSSDDETKRCRQSQMEETVVQELLMDLPFPDLEVDWPIELELDDGATDDMFKLEDLSILSCEFELDEENQADDEWAALLQCLV